MKNNTLFQQFQCTRMSMQTPHILGNNIINTLGILDGYKSNIGFPWYNFFLNMGFNVIGYTTKNVNAL